MNQKNIYNRTDDLKKKLNDFLTKLTCNKKDYFAILKQDDLISLKLALSDINNVLTLKTTLAFADWLVDFLNLKEEEKYEKLIKDINKTKPNTNGFDIKFEGDKYKVIAEIKAIVPINNGDYYGAAQRNSILDDAIKLMKGKKKDIDTKEYIKIIGLLDLGEKTKKAIEKLRIPSKNIRTNDPKRLARHEIVKKLEIIDGKNFSDLKKDKIYIKKIRIEN